MGRKEEISRRSRKAKETRKKLQEKDDDQNETGKEASLGRIRFEKVSSAKKGGGREEEATEENKTQ